MKRVLVAALLLASPALAASYTLPDETAAFKPGPNLDLVQQNCSACHSADYISTQPPAKDPHAFWQSEVVKMRGAYGAPIDPADIPNIVQYLSTTYR